jgi:hypothetical protein
MDAANLFHYFTKKKAGSRQSFYCLLPSACCLLLLQPKEGTNAAHALEHDFPAAARHNAAIAPPAGLVIQVYTVHVEVLADLFDLALVPRHLLIQDIE